MILLRREEPAMTLSRPGPERVMRYEDVRASREFRQIRRRLRRFAVPTVLGVLGWYFLYILLAACAPDLMAEKVLGDVNVGLCFGLAQILSTVLVTTVYVRWARVHLDPSVDRLRERLERGDLR